MYENLETTTRTARKQVRCNWCNRLIQKGEQYEYQRYLYDGEFCTWKSHLACSRVASAIWDYADPDDGMDDWLFGDTCQEVCRCFICPDCDRWDAEDQDCLDDHSFCVDKMDKFFETKELYCTRDGWRQLWRVRDKNECLKRT